MKVRKGRGKRREEGNDKWAEEERGKKKKERKSFWHCLFFPSFLPWDLSHLGLSSYFSLSFWDIVVWGGTFLKKKRKIAFALPISVSSLPFLGGGKFAKCITKKRQKNKKNRFKKRKHTTVLYP